MGRDEQSDARFRSDWRIRATTGVVVAACMAGALILGPAVGIHGFWPGMLTIASAIIVGIGGGRILGKRLFRSSRADSRNDLPHV